MPNLVLGSGIKAVEASGNITVSATTGWAAHSDTQYTEVSPFSLVGGADWVNLPNNSGSVDDEFKPSDITALFDSGKVTGINGETRGLTLSFAVKPTTGTSPTIRVKIDIGGAIGEIKDYTRAILFDKGNGVEDRYLSSFIAYTRDTWEANGGQWMIKSSSNCDIYNIRTLVAALTRV